MKNIGGEKIKIKCKLLIVLFLLIPSSVYAQTDDEVESLRGLKGVYVLIDSLHPDIEADGLRENQIHTDVELKLRLAGIKVLNEVEYLMEKGKPYLYIRFNSFRHESGLHIINIGVGLNQSVYLERDLNIKVYGAVTWDLYYTGTVGAKNVNQIRDIIKDLVDEFINDYLSVNPKD